MDHTSPKHSSEYYTWFCPETETEDDVADKADDCGPAGETTEHEGTTEDEEEMSEDQNYIKQDWCDVHNNEHCKTVWIYTSAQAPESSYMID